MKLGRYIPLGSYKDVKMGYGTINHKELKTIYLSLNSWLDPDNNCDDYERIVKSARNKIKKLIYGLGHDFFRPESIVDLDVRTKGISQDKRSFMNVEITLYVIEQINIKDKELKNSMDLLLKEIIDTCLDDKMLFNFHKKKK